MHLALIAVLVSIFPSAPTYCQLLVT